MKSARISKFFSNLTFKGTGLILGFFPLVLIFQNCNSNSKFGVVQSSSVEVTAAQAQFCADNPAAVECVLPEKSFCVFEGQAIENGKSITTYAAASVRPGETCLSQERSCSNGVLSGSYDFKDCQVLEFHKCRFSGSDILHGQSVFAYPVAVVPSGSVCPNPVERICNDGILSGSGEFKDCRVAVPYTPPVTQPTAPKTCAELGYSGQSWRSVWYAGFIGNVGPVNGNEPNKYGTGWLALAAEWGGDTYPYWYCP